MNTKPILFNALMVRALLAGRKTQTRRPIKVQPCSTAAGASSEKGVWRWHLQSPAFYYGDPIKCQHGQIGDLLWVRENMREDCVGSISIAVYDADNYISRFEWWKHNRFCPSIHMPRSVSRLTLKITDIRVERVAQMADNDAVAEGMQKGYEGYHVEDGRYFNVRPALAFRSLWDSINEKRGFGWDANPWVWVIEFEVIHKNVDEVINGYVIQEKIKEVV